MTDPIRILFASDIHLGNMNMPQEEVAEAFAKIIVPILSETDLFCINGDLFDTQVLFDNQGFDPIYTLLMILFMECERHQIKLRILQGTWEHDRSQVERLVAFYKNGNYTFDFKHVKGIELEEISFSERTLRFFYIPDSLPFKSSNDIVEVLSERMQERGWDYVDYGCMHGFFEFTFPKNVSQKNVVVFNKEQFPFVRKMIDVGHVHEHRSDDFVFSNGSFDRMCHGDENPKGCIRVLDYPEKFTAKFVENIYAAVFDTLSFDSGDDTETIRTKINKHLSSLSTNRKISLRFLTETSEQYNVIREWMRLTHPKVACSRKAKDAKSDGQMMTIISSDLIVEIEQTIVPTRKTLAVDIRHHIPEDYEISIDAINTYLDSA